MRLLRRNVALLSFTLGAALAGLAFFLFGRGIASIYGLFGLFWGAVITPFVVARNPFPREKETFATASRDELVIEGHRVYERPRVAQAYVQPGPGDAIIRVVLTDGSKLTLAAARDVAEALVRALGASATERTATLTVRSPVPGWLAWLGGFVITVGTVIGAVNFTSPEVGGPLCIAAVAAWAVLLLLRAWPAYATVGADGVEIRWLGRRRFHPFSEMRSAEMLGSQVVLRLRSGRVVKIATKTQYDPEARQGADDHALIARIGEAHAAYALTAGRAAAELLSRGSRSARDWVSHLQSVAGSRGRAGYRSATLTDEQLLHTLSDPAASATARAGAAVALAADNQPQVRARIAAAAEACAEPRVRAALGAIAAAHQEEEWEEAVKDLADPIVPGGHVS